MNLQPFIDLGWYTVPLKGELVRYEDGTKSIPEFEKGWKSKYAVVFNDKPAELGGAMTGSNSGFIAIDCDNTETYQLFRALDPDYDAVFLSKGKGDKECGTIIYNYTDELAYTFSLTTHGLALDFYSEGGFVYLPTEANETKHTWESIPEIKDAPKLVVATLNQFADVRRRQKSEERNKRDNEIYNGNCLRPLVDTYLAKHTEIHPELFKIITPKEFRDSDNYRVDGYLHPDDVPYGSFSRYLSQVSAILGADISIDTDTYIHTMKSINNLASDPMPVARLEKTILDPMLNGLEIEGETVWRYREDWDAYKMYLQTRNKSTLELFFDERTCSYYALDYSAGTVRRFNRDGEMFSYVSSYCVAVPKKAKILERLPPVEVVRMYNKPFGFIESVHHTERRCNTFKQTKYLNILHDPKAYASQYTEPRAVIGFLESLVPEDGVRNYLLGFIKRKLLRAEYSPIILMFLGVHGSGKDTFVSLLDAIMGGYINRPSTEVFLEKHNSWITENFFTHLDDYGEQLNDREKVVVSGKLKQLSGSTKVAVRAMGTNTYDTRHNVTFILTANNNPLMLEDGDRRILFMDTPNVLANSVVCWENGGISKLHNKLFDELSDFMYYLATEVKELTADEYVIPYASKGKHSMLAKSMNPSDRIMYCLKHNLHSDLDELINESGAFVEFENLHYKGESGFLNVEALLDVYQGLTSFNNSAAALRSSAKKMFGTSFFTTYGGEKVMVVKVGEGWFKDRENEIEL